LSRNSLKQVLSGWDVFFIAVGQIIGAGVIALTGIAIGMTGPSVIFAYLLSAVLVLIVTILNHDGRQRLTSSRALTIRGARDSVAVG
jgi:L-asparagine transporter-like permease